MRQAGQNRFAVLASSVAVVAIVTLGEVLGLQVQSGGGGPRPDETTTVPTEIKVRVNDTAIDFGTVVTFPEQVMVTGATLSVGEFTGIARLWPLDGRDPEDVGLKVRLPAGTPAVLEGSSRPHCDGDWSEIDVSFSVTTRGSGGSTERHQYTPHQPDALAAAMEKWCAQGPDVSAELVYLAADGYAVVDVAVTNPGPEVISVAVPAYSDDRVSWTAASTTVGPGQQVRFNIHGAQIACEPGELASWEEGRLLIDGKPFDVYSAGGWCRTPQ